jgi:hypothetical protein
VKTLAEKVKEGVDSVEGAEATIFQVRLLAAGSVAPPLPQSPPFPPSRPVP